MACSRLSGTRRCGCSALCVCARVVLSQRHSLNRSYNRLREQFESSTLTVHVNAANGGDERAAQKLNAALQSAIKHRLTITTVGVQANGKQALVAKALLDVLTAQVHVQELELSADDVVTWKAFTEAIAADWFSLKRLWLLDCSDAFRAAVASALGNNTRIEAITFRSGVRAAEQSTPHTAAALRHALKQRVAPLALTLDAAVCSVLHADNNGQLSEAHEPSLPLWRCVRSLSIPYIPAPWMTLSANKLRLVQLRSLLVTQLRDDDAPANFVRFLSGLPCLETLNLGRLNDKLVPAVWTVRG